MEKLKSRRTIAQKAPFTKSYAPSQTRPELFLFQLEGHQQILWVYAYIIGQKLIKRGTKNWETSL